MSKKEGKEKYSVTKELEKGIGNPEKEQMSWKLPREKPVAATTESGRGYNHVDADYAIMSEFKGNNNVYNIHTHPRARRDDVSLGIPGSEDLRAFLKHNHKIMVVVQTTSDGEIEGYTVIKKSKRTDARIEDARKNFKKAFDYREQKINLLRKEMSDQLDGSEYNLYNRLIKNVQRGINLNDADLHRLENFHSLLKNQQTAFKFHQDLDELYNKPYSRFTDVEGDIHSYVQKKEDLEAFSHKYALSYKFVPTENNEFNATSGNFEKKKTVGLENKVELIALGLFGIGLLLQLPRITGFTMSEGLTKSFTSLTLIFILMSLMFLLYVIIKKK